MEQSKYGKDKVKNLKTLLESTAQPTKKPYESNKQKPKPKPKAQKEKKDERPNFIASHKRDKENDLSAQVPKTKQKAEPQNIEFKAQSKKSNPQDAEPQKVKGYGELEQSDPKQSDLAMPVFKPKDDKDEPHFVDLDPNQDVWLIKLALPEKPKGEKPRERYSLHR